VVSRWDQGHWIRMVKAAMKGTTSLPVHSLRSPSFVPGIDLSDHMSYWPHGIPSLMVTDTAFYRNPFYHTPEDTPEKLDYRRMAQVAVAGQPQAAVGGRPRRHRARTCQPRVLAVGSMLMAGSGPCRSGQDKTQGGEDDAQHGQNFMVKPAKKVLGPPGANSSRLLV